MNKTAFKIFASFVFCAVVVSLSLLFLNFLAFSITASDAGNLYYNSPRKKLQEISENLTRTKTGYSLLEYELPTGLWCILINQDGNIIWNENMPDDIPSHYSLNDVAVMTRWYLEDYPVYVRAEDYGLLVLGYPKNSVGKYSVEYSMEWFRMLPQRILLVVVLNLVLAILLASILGKSLYKKMKLLTQAIYELKQEKSIKIKEKGIFRELARNINSTSNAIQRKNALLSQRDQARQNWIAGISHDIRTPLSIIMGNSESIWENNAVPGEERKKAEAITGQAMKIKSLVEDLNLISSLEYDMQPIRRKPIKICSLIRRVVTEMLNSGISENFQIELVLTYEKAQIFGDEALMERAVFNLLNNSIKHNPEGCTIEVSEGGNREYVYFAIKDNGSGVPQEVLSKLDQIPKSNHGLGLPMAYKIVAVHGGFMEAYNEDGFFVRINLPGMNQ